MHVAIGRHAHRDPNCTSQHQRRLKANYEPGEGHSLPRQTVYENYEEFCRQTKTEPINNATFGKLIRAIFPNLKTRRLGTRGNSKVHYAKCFWHASAFITTGHMRILT